MTEKEQADLILAALNAALAPAVAYEYDKVPGLNGNTGTRPTKFAIVTITRRFIPKRTVGGIVTVRGFRVNVRYAAKSTNDARNMRELTTATLEDQILTAPSGELGPFMFETSQTIGPDDGYQSGSDTFVF